VGLSKKIDAAAGLLKPHRTILRRLSSTGGRISFHIGWFCGQHTGEALGYEILADMADLHIALDLNIYVSDKLEG
jgi:hypothetical protein